MAQRKIAVDDVQQLAELLSSRDRGHEDKATVPDWANPERYPRRVEITDDETLAAITHMDTILTEMRQFMRKAERLEAKLILARAELYDKLEETYPTILVARRGGAGLKDWHGKWYYVGWDHPRYADERGERPGDGQGQYL